jgi:hypothetical protein
MANEPRKPPPNRDLEQPQRTGETIQPNVPSERGSKDLIERRRFPKRKTNTTSPFDDRTLTLMRDLWPETERFPILEKYQRALFLAGRGVLNRGEATVQVAENLIKLRDGLVHYKPEWHDVEGQHHRLQDRLQGKFPLKVVPAGFSLWFPNQCLSAGCATWGTRVVANFSKLFCDQIRIPPRF